MARVTVEDCIDKVPNRFELVALASERAKQIGSGALITVEEKKDKIGIIALREIACGKLDIETLKEELIKSLQRKNKLDERGEEENLHAEAKEDIKDDDFNATNTDIFVSESYSDLETEQIYVEDIIDEDK